MAGIRKFASSVDLTLNQLLNAVIQPLAGAPGGPVAGQIYFDTTKKQIGYYSGTGWVYGSTYSLPEAEEAVLGGIELAEDLKGGTAKKPKVSGLHLTGDTAINHKLTELSAPTNPKDAANKEYVDGKVNGLSWKTPAALVTTAVLPAHGAEAAEVILSTAQEVLKVDGVNVTVGERILVKNEVEAKEDGIYEVVKKGGAGTEKWELKRTVDANTTVELQDATLFAEKGTANEGHEFTQTATVTTVGTTAQVWVEVQSGLAIGAEAPYLERSGNKIKIVPVTANHAVIPAEGSVSAAITGNARVKNFAFKLKAGVTELVIKHELATYQIQVQAQEESGGVPAQPIELAWEPEGENEVKITWPTAPSAGTVLFLSVVG